MSELPPSAPSSELLEAFRLHFHQYNRAVDEAVSNQTDEVVLSRLSDDLREYTALVEEHSHVFPPEELSVLQTNLALMLGDVEIQYQQALDASHHGRPAVIERVHTGQRGRPRIEIDPQFLQFAHEHRSTTGIGRFLGVSRGTVRTALLRQGLVQPQPAPFDDSVPGVLGEADTAGGADGGPVDEILDPQYVLPQALPAGLQGDAPPAPSTGELSTIADWELDSLILRLRTHFRRAGISILDGMLRRLGHRVQRERIRDSLSRIDPVHRVFQRIRIRRRHYHVAGPNSLWHHDGQHGLIRWGIVIHGFIDGYSRLITGLRASDNNRGSTVLLLFLDAAALYGVPSRLRGDHGVENIEVATWMELHRGMWRGSYIWGRSIHNVRIERLWVDITAQIGAFWSDSFTLLELQHGLDINNVNHIWLLHYIFLPTINDQLTFFAQSWNEHRIQIRDGPNRSPADMFGFDTLVHGARGNALPEDLPEAELEVYGVDWEGLHDDALLQSQRNNNSAENGWTSWLGRSGPPEHLNEVPVESPAGPFGPEAIQHLDTVIAPWHGRAADSDIVEIWIHGLACCRTMNPNAF